MNDTHTTTYYYYTFKDNHIKIIYMQLFKEKMCYENFEFLQ